MISVIIPTYNSEQTIKICIESLLKQIYDDYEIIVVDNGSTDHTVDIVEKFPIKLITERRRGSYTARNTGAKAAKGDILAFMDSDQTVAPHWLDKLTKPLVSKEEVATLGGTKSAKRDRWSIVGQKIYDDYLKRCIIEEGYAKTIDTRNFAIIKNVFTEVEGFDESVQYVGDAEFGARLVENGYKIKFIENCEVKHFHKSSLKKRAKRRYQQGYWTPDVYQKHKNYFDRKLKGYRIQIESCKKAMFFLFFAFPLIFIYLPIAVFSLLLSLYFFGISPYYALYVIKHGVDEGILNLISCVSGRVGISHRLIVSFLKKLKIKIR